MDLAMSFVTWSPVPLSGEPAFFCHHPLGAVAPPDLFMEQSSAGPAPVSSWVCKFIFVFLFISFSHSWLYIKRWPVWLSLPDYSNETYLLICCQIGCTWYLSGSFSWRFQTFKSQQAFAWQAVGTGNNRSQSLKEWGWVVPDWSF